MGVSRNPEFGFTREMLDGVLTLIHRSGSGGCPKCGGFRFEVGEVGGPYRCHACGWKPVRPGTERGLAHEAALRIEVLLSLEKEEGD